MNESQNLVEKDKVRSVINELFIQTDNKHWERVKACFTDMVLFDMSSAGGGKPEYISPHKIIDAWENGLKNIEALHHQAGNFEINVEEFEANVFCYGIAIHYLSTEPEEKTRTFVGSYNFHLIKEDGQWKLDLFKFNQKFVTGNFNLGSI